VGNFLTSSATIAFLRRALLLVIAAAVIVIVVVAAAAAYDHVQWQAGIGTGHIEIAGSVTILLAIEAAEAAVVVVVLYFVHDT
jgi:hypothetical protein